MLAAVSSLHFSWSFELSSFIMVNILEALNKILRDHHLMIFNYYLFEKTAMVAQSSSTYFSGSFKLRTIIMVNNLEKLHKILRGDRRLNDCY